MGGRTCAKCMIIFCNVLIGAIGLTIGIMGVVQKVKYEDKNGELAMGVGFSIFAVSFIACLGAATESRIVQIIYIVLISILLVVCLACGIMLVTIVNTEAYDKHFMEAIGGKHETKYRLDWLVESFEEFGKEEIENKTCCGCMNATHGFPGTLENTATPGCRNNEEGKPDESKDCCVQYKALVWLFATAVGSLLLFGALIEILAIIVAVVMIKEIKQIGGGYPG